MANNLFISFIIPHRESEDVSGTANLAREACEKNGIECEIYAISGNHPTKQRNISLGLPLKGDFVYFIDNDTCVTEKALAEFKRVLEVKGQELGVLGGPTLTPATDTYLMKSFGAVLSSPAAVGKISSRYSKQGKFRETDDSELILCNLLVRLEIFNKFGKFSEKLYPNEENEFIFRLKQAGVKVYYSPDLFIYRSQRKTFGNFLKQMFVYGRGRGEQTRLSPKSLRPGLLAPSLLFLYCAALIPALVLGLSPFFALPLAFYALLLIAPLLALFPGLLPAHLYPVLAFAAHIMYGIGFLWGIIKGRYKADKIDFTYKLHKVEK